MNKIVEELKAVNVFYVATLDGDRPHVRPFGSTTEFEGNAYICTNNTKLCYKEMIANPNIEISGMHPDGSWIRIVAKAIRDDRDEARTAMLTDPTGPSQLYTVGDGIFEVLRLEDAVCTKYSFTADPEIIQ